MKKLLLTVLFLTSLIAGAQERKWEHRISVGAGLMNERAEGYSGSGLALKAGYGLRYFCAEQWSLMCLSSHNTILVVASAVGR